MTSTCVFCGMVIPDGAVHSCVSGAGTYTGVARGAPAGLGWSGGRTEAAAAPAVDHPAHYGGADNPYEVIKVLENWLTPEEFIGALKFNVIKYQARARKKDGAIALEKSAWYSAYLADYVKRKGIA